MRTFVKVFRLVLDAIVEPGVDVRDLSFRAAEAVIDDDAIALGFVFRELDTNVHLLVRRLGPTHVGRVVAAQLVGRRKACQAVIDAVRAVNALNALVEVFLDRPVRLLLSKIFLSVGLS